MRVNLISKSEADKIAKKYLDNYDVNAVYVTKDGQVFLPGNENYLKHHEQRYGLEPSWLYEKNPTKQKVEPKKKKETGLSFKELKTEFQKLTDEGKIDKEDWFALNFKELREKYTEINKG